MILSAAELLEQLSLQLNAKRQSLSVTPGIALIWIGSDPATTSFIKAKQKKAAELQCDFFLHHFESANDRQLEALILSINSKKSVHGLVMQLPLANSNNTERLISLIDPLKDIDNLLEQDIYPSPTPTGIVSLLKASNINLSQEKTVIIGDGRLVGKPLRKLFEQNNWPYQLIKEKAQEQIATIRKASLLISCSGVAGLIQPEMVTKEMVVIDGSGVDVEVKLIEPLVKSLTPAKGAIGPLTVSYLFDNLLTAARVKV